MHHQTIRLLCYLFLLIPIAAPAEQDMIDSDHDNVADSVDKCPETAQIQKISPDFKLAMAVDPERLDPEAKAYPVDEDGCEFDNDGDGVVNSQDYCPDDTEFMLSAGIATNGCPRHSDFDGTPDYRDDCPDTPRESKRTPVAVLFKPSEFA
ncbi:MAG: thrombospondin type 3 repeat-containing protein [Thiolinea sp.]